MTESEVMQPTRPLRDSEKLVGLNFNPSNNLRVQRAKEICAELAEIVNDEAVRSNNWELHRILREHTLGEVLNAQMNVVKLITLER